MRRRYGYQGYYSRRQLRAAERHDYQLRRRMSLLPARGVLAVLLVLAALLVLASLI